jgi:guanylate cyclase soluble subunit beta
MVKGLVRQASIEMFHQEVTVVVRERLQEKRKNLMGEHIIFSISSDDPKHKLIRPELRPVVLKGRKKTDQVGYISLSIFCQAFPNHICINKQLFIEHCGKFVQDEFDVAGKRLVKINDILVLVQPEDVTMSFKNFLLYLNSPFVFRSKHSLKRNEGKVTKQFLLKGQMCLLNNGEHLLFMGSPYFSTVHELIESNIYISDMQLNDITRDLILLNQNRIAQQEIK